MISIREKDKCVYYLKWFLPPQQHTATSFQVFNHSMREQGFKGYMQLHFCKTSTCKQGSSETLWCQALYMQYGHVLQAAYAGKGKDADVSNRAIGQVYLQNRRSRLLCYRNAIFSAFITIKGKEREGLLVLNYEKTVQVEASQHHPLLSTSLHLFLSLACIPWQTQ